MVERLEQNFGSLTIPLNGLRTHADLNNGVVVVPETLKNHEEIKTDLEGALAAGRRNDPDRLTGGDVIAEVNDENSFYHGRSAYRVFTRAAAFEPVLTVSRGLFPPCPNQTLVHQEVSIKPLRDYYYQHGPRGIAELFPETVADRVLYVDQLKTGLEIARGDLNPDFLSGREIFEEISLSCNDTDALDLFWQTAVGSAWVAGTTIISAAPLGIPEQGPPEQNAPPNLPFPSAPATPGQPPVYPSAGDDTVEVVREIGGSAVDVTLAGGGFYFQRGVVEEYKMTFRPRPTDGGGEMVLEEVDRISRAAVDRSEPITVEAFRQKERGIFKKGEREAEILWNRAKTKSQPPAEIVRTGVKRGWIKGALSLRRVFGWVTMVSGAADLAMRFFRDDKRGLDGPLTDAGMSPLGSRLALVGAGAAGTAAIILTGGMALPVLAGVGALSAAGLAWETHCAFEEANREFDDKFDRREPQEPSKPAPLVVELLPGIYSKRSRVI